MMRFIRPRLRVPAATAVLGTAFAVAYAIGRGWAPAIFIGVYTVALAIGYYVWGGRDSDRGALIGSRADERQATLQMKVMAFQGKVLTAGGVVAYVIALATNYKPVWPFTLFLLLAGLSFSVGWGIYRDDRPDGPDPEHFTAVQSPGPRDSADVR